MAKPGISCPISFSSLQRHGNRDLLKQSKKSVIRAEFVTPPEDLILLNCMKRIGEYLAFRDQHFFFIFFVVLFCTIQTSAQHKYNFFYGKISDQVSNKGIPDVNIYFEGSVKGAISNNNGDFSFYIDTLPLIMVVSHLGYETKKLLLDKTSFSLNVFLQPKIQQLEEIVVSGKSNYETVFHDQYLNIIDYEVDTATVFILTDDLRSTSSALICKNFKGDTIAGNKFFSIHPRKLFKDCLGNIHLLTGDSAYQVFRDSRQLKLIYPVTLKKFNDVLVNCVCSSGDMLFIRKFEGNGQTVSYYKVDRKTNQRQMLTAIEDSLKTKMLRRNPHDNSLLNQTVQPDSRDDFVEWSYVHKILYRPVSTALCKIGDFICIINTVERTIEFYKPDGSYAFKLLLMIRKVHEGTWTKDIFIDEVKRKVYTTFAQNGYYFLYSIDLNTGELERVLAIAHLYPEKLRVHKGYIYYLYHKAGSGDNKELFRQSIF
jgi:hypothetical protein